MRFTITILHAPGKDLTIADTLSRAPAATASDADVHFCQDTDMFVNTVIPCLPTTERQLAEVKQKQAEDEVFQQLKKYCKSGWPNKHDVPVALRPYFSVSAELTVQHDILMRNNQTVVLLSPCQDILARLHTGHQGITKCRRRALQSVWWPGLSKQLVSTCVECCRNKHQNAEPLLPASFPKLPWQKVSIDMFVWNNSHYLLVIDYFSRYIEITKLTSESTGCVIKHMKSIFARHGIPQELISDNGPQYSSREFTNFAKEYGFVHDTYTVVRYILVLSICNPQANGEAERAVRTVKALLEKSTDLYLVLLTYRATPIMDTGCSPAELLMNRKIRITILQIHLCHPYVMEPYTHVVGEF